MGSDASAGAAAPVPTVAASPAIPAGARLSAWLGAHGLLVTVCALFVFLWSFAAPGMVEADSWLTVLGGREIVDHGIPREDALAAMTEGREWVDQQWLAQLGFYAVEQAGGMKLTVIATILLLVASVALALALAVRRGASARSAAIFAIVPSFYFISFVRAQVVSNLLFVGLLALLASESRRPTRRVFLAFPLLALWANVHGAALVGACLVALLGASEVVAPRRGTTANPTSWTRIATLVTAPWLCLLATPYGLSTVEYYRSTLGNPVFPQVLTEWMPPMFPTISGISIALPAAATIALVARKPRDLTLFELGALGFTLVGGLLANRSITWFAFAALVLVPPLLERRREGDVAPALARFRTRSATAATVLGLAALGSIAVRSEESVASHWPQRGAERVADVLRSDQGARVFASHEFGDWLLYTRPELRGRVAFDGRWELLSPLEMRSILDYYAQVGESWEAPSRGYRVLALNPRTQERLVQTYERRAGARTLFRNDRLVVFDRGPDDPWATGGTTRACCPGS